MTYTLDSEIGAVMAGLAEQAAAMPVPERGDWQTLRANANMMMTALASASPAYDDVETRSFSCSAADGALIALSGTTKRKQHLDLRSYTLMAEA